MNDYTTRPATAGDVDAVCALVVAVDVEEYGEPDYEPADVRDDWARPRFDLDRDTSLVEVGGATVGYAVVWDKAPHELVVADVVAHPDHGVLYGPLVDHVLARAAEHAAAGTGAATLRVFNAEPNQKRANVLHRNGFEVVRVFRRMVADLPVDIAAAPSPGVSVRPAVPETDLRMCWSIAQESFESHHDFAPEPFETWRARLVGSDTYRPRYWWLAEVDGVPAGALIGTLHEESGWVRMVGVLASARGRGAGTALLLTAFGAFAADGCPRVGLGVDSENVTGAMALYERLGMRAEQRYDYWSRTVTAR